MKKNIMKWFIIILVLSGWVVSGVIYVNLKQEKAKAETEIVELKSELQAYQFLISDVEKSIGQIDSIVETLENLKNNLELLRNKMEKGAAKNESSQNGK